jgi:glycosyltransferase involved in cell wall biosynthesis
MRIALLSTSALPAPPKAYGGTELIVAELAKTLTRIGHHVTVFATGDSTTEGELRWHHEGPTWPPDDYVELRHAAYAWRSICSADSPFDVVHAHHIMAIPFSLMSNAPSVYTLHHDRADRLVDLYVDFRDVTYVAISKRQADLMPEVGVRHVVHHGLDIDLYEANTERGDWLAFVGRLAPEKGPHLAIDAAVAAGLPLRIGGRPHWVNEAYFEGELKPRLARAGELVDWHGEVALAPKLELLRGARATLFPIQWEEPFGLVMIESMLLGTPVIAFRRGATPEVIDEGITGFIVNDVAEMVDRILHIDAIDRKGCRRRAQQRWSSVRMARDYERVYEESVRNRRDAKSWRRPRPHLAPTGTR